MSDDSPNPLRIGLTGGIASGKTTVANLFADLAVPIVDTDVIAREVVARGQPSLIEIKKRFGERMLFKDGTLDRRALRKVIFSNDTARLDLEAITHPRILEETLRQSQAAGGSYHIIVVPLLTTSRLRDHVDRVLVIDCNEQTQIERLLARDAETIGQARSMLAAQSSRKERLAIADDVILNNGLLDSLRRQVTDLHRIYLQLAENPDRS